MQFCANIFRVLHSTFAYTCRRVRDAGLQVSVHCAEVMNVAETEAILDFVPDRLGHMCVLTYGTMKRLLSPLSNAGHREHYLPLSPIFKPGSELATAIPIELCPTSNALTLHLPTIAHHPTLDMWLQYGYPVVICTDDSGVFDVTLSSEYKLVAESASLSQHAVVQLARNGFAAAFCSEATKAGLLRSLDAFYNNTLKPVEQATLT
jgi:adenosine deaminase